MTTITPKQQNQAQKDQNQKNDNFLMDEGKTRAFEQLRIFFINNHHKSFVRLYYHKKSEKIGRSSMFWKLLFKNFSGFSC